MNTDKSNVGKGDYCNSLTQPAQNGPNSPASPDNRQPINPDIYRAQSQLLDLVDSFMELSSPIVAITNFMEVWLSAKPDQLLDSYFRTNLTSALRLIAFLSELRDAHSAWLGIEEITRNQKEVNHE